MANLTKIKKKNKLILLSLRAKDKNGTTNSIHLRVDEFVGKINGEAFQFNRRKCEKLKTIFSNSEDALEAIGDHKVVLSSLNS